MIKWIKGGLCLLPDGEGFETRQVDIEVVDSSIASLGQAPDVLLPGTEVIDAWGCLVMPGFVNAHTHSPDNLVRGLAPDLPLELWSLKTSAGRESRTPREVYVSALLGCVEMLRSGTTTVLDHIRFNPRIDPEGIDAVCRAYQDAGMRAVVAPVVADKPVIDTMPFELADWEGAGATGYGRDKTLAAGEQAAVLEEFVRRLAATGATPPPKSGCRACPPEPGSTVYRAASRCRVYPAVGPSGPQRCTDELLLLCAGISEKYGVIFHSHVLETKLQLAMAEQLYRKSMIRHLDELGILNERTNLVHMVWASDEDLDLVARCRAHVVHNPVSNTRLGSGVANVPGMLCRGINVGLGTDSSCCNDSNNMLETAKWAALIHNLSSPDPCAWVGPHRTFEMATAGGARALGLGNVTGRIAPGMAADLVILSLDQPALVPLNDAVRQIVLGGASVTVKSVLVDGEVVFSDGRCLKIDEEQLWAEARELAARRVSDSSGVFKSAAGLSVPIERMYRRIHNI